MLEQLARRAAGEGIERFVFEILVSNAAMLRVVAGAGFAITREEAGGVVEVTMSIEPTAAYEARSDARDHVGIAASIRRFLDPASVAVYGASPRRGTIGGELFRNILDGGSSARIPGQPSRGARRGRRGPADAARCRSRGRAWADLPPGRRGTRRRDGCARGRRPQASASSPPGSRRSG